MKQSFSKFQLQLSSLSPHSIAKSQNNPSQSLFSTLSTAKKGQLQTFGDPNPNPQANLSTFDQVISKLRGNTNDKKNTGKDNENMTGNIKHTEKKETSNKYHQYYMKKKEVSGLNRSYETLSNYRKVPNSVQLCRQQFQNPTNTYIKVVDLLELYLRLGRNQSKYKNNLLAYIKDSTDLEKLLAELDAHKDENSEFQILLYILHKGQDRLISLYLRLRKQIISRCGLDPSKYRAESTHNQNKYFLREAVSLKGIQVDYVYWGMLADIAKCELREEMLWELSDCKRSVDGVRFMQVCVWTASQ